MFTCSILSVVLIFIDYVQSFSIFCKTIPLVWTNNLHQTSNNLMFFPVDLFSLAIALEMIGKFAVTTAYSLVYAFTAEIYPTVLRNTALGACSMASRIGSITAPFFIYLSKDLLSSL